MAEKTIRVCDVFGATNKVRRYRVTIERQDGLDLLNESSWNKLHHNTLDLCPRAASRLQSFVVRGSTPPSPRDTPNAEDEPAAEK